MAIIVNPNIKNNKDIKVKNFKDIKIPKNNNNNSLTNSNKLETQYNNLINSFQRNNIQVDNRSFIEKALGINVTTKQKGNILSDTFDILSRPLDEVKTITKDITSGNTKNILKDSIQGILTDTGENISGVQALGLESAHLDTFTKFLVNTAVNIGFDPLMWVPTGAISSAFVKSGKKIASNPLVNKIISPIKNSELGQAVSNLYKTTKNQLGKMFVWNYGTSDELKNFIKNSEAGRVSISHNLFMTLNRLLKGREGIAEDLFHYAKTNQLPADKEFIKQFKNNHILAHEYMTKTIRNLGIENPDNTWKSWLKENHNGNEIVGKKNFFDFLFNPENKNFKDDWDGFINSGNYLLPNGEIKNINQAVQDFYNKKITDWKNLTIKDVEDRFSENIYKLYLKTSPPITTLEKTLDTLQKNKEIRLSINDPEQIKNFIKKFSFLTGKKDFLLDSNYLIKDGKKILNKDYPQIYSQLFKITSLENAGKKSFNLYSKMINKMKLSNDPELQKVYQNLIKNNSIEKMKKFLLEQKGQGVILKLRTNLDDLKDTKFFDSSNNELYTKIYKNYDSKKYKEFLEKDISNGIRSIISNNKNAEILSNGIIGEVEKDFNNINSLSNEDEILDYSKNLANKILNLDIKLPAYEITGFTGYKTNQYVNALTFVNTQLFKIIKNYDLDPASLEKFSILRNVVNPELAETIKLVDIAKNKINKTGKIDMNLYKYIGNSPENFIESNWLMDSIRVNKSLGFKYFSTDPILSMARSLRVLPQNFEFGKIIQNAFKTQDIKFLSDDEKLLYNFKSKIPLGKKIINSTELKNKLQSIKNILPESDIKDFNKLNEQLESEKKVLISIGLDDILTNTRNAEKDSKNIADYINQITYKWKQVALATTGFHIRNTFTFFANAQTNGIKVTELFPEYLKAQKDIINVYRINNKILKNSTNITKSINNNKDMEEFLKNINISKNDIKTYQEYVNLSKKGICSQSQINGDFWEMMDKLGNTTKKNSAFRKGWDKVFNSNMMITQAMDDASRWATYRIILRDSKPAKALKLYGKTNEELAQNFVRFTYFDYNALTNFEKNIMRKIIPFYTWGRKNLEFQFRALINNQEKFNRLNKIFNAWEQSEDYNTNETPDWIADNMWLPIKNKNEINFVKLNPPVADLSNIFNGNELLNRINPLYKFIIETSTGKSLFNDQPTNLLKEFQSTFWSPIQKMLVSPFDIPLGAIPLGNGKTFGEILGHPNNYNQRNSIWYSMNIKQLQNSYFWQQIDLLSQIKKNLENSGINFNSPIIKIPKLKFNIPKLKIKNTSKF